jgi:hypothetical protein
MSATHPHVRVSVHPDVYRDREGYSIRWRDPDRAFPQRVFVEHYAQAAQLKAVIKSGGDTEACLRRIWSL